VYYGIMVWLLQPTTIGNQVSDDDDDDDDDGI
jgi:hypothetical protein